MLVLTRHQGERIRIGNDITITVIEADSNRVRLGFDAPKDVVVDREEVFLLKKKKEESGERQS